MIAPGINSLLTKRTVYHFLCWFTLLLLLTLEETGDKAGDFMYFLTNEIINLFFYAVIYYFIAFYLIPRYLNSRRVFTFLGLMVLVALVVTPIKVFVLWFKFSDDPASRDKLLNQQQYYYLISLVVAGVSTIVKITIDWARQITEQGELERRTMQTELDFLKSQINPHFLFNTLNSIYSLALKKSDAAPEMVIKLSEMMRYMLYECNEKQTPLTKEINYLTNYLDLERLRQSKGMEIDFKVIGDPDDIRIAPLLFIPFVENSFKHGDRQSVSKGFIHISMTILEEKVEFEVQNSQAEMRPTPDKRKSGGIGLINVRRRLELLYPKKHELNIISDPDVYSVRLSVNIHPISLR